MILRKLDEVLLGTISRELLDMPSRAVNTAAGHTDASGKIKSDQPETSPENGYFQGSASVCLFLGAPPPGGSRLAPGASQ